MYPGFGACRSWDLSFLNKGDIRPRLACESYYQHLPLGHTFPTASTVPDSVTAFFVTSARTSRSAERTCSSCANIELTAFSSWAFAAFGLPGPIGEDAALASGSNLEASSTLIPTSARTITKKLLGFMAGASARFWRH